MLWKGGRTDSALGVVAIQEGWREREEERGSERKKKRPTVQATDETLTVAFDIQIFLSVRTQKEEYKGCEQRGHLNRHTQAGGLLLFSL